MLNILFQQRLQPVKTVTLTNTKKIVINLYFLYFLFDEESVLLMINCSCLGCCQWSFGVVTTERRQLNYCQSLNYLVWVSYCISYYIIVFTCMILRWKDEENWQRWETFHMLNGWLENTWKREKSADAGLTILR